METTPPAITAVLVAWATTFLVGGLWYGPLFGSAWQRLVGLEEATLRRTLGQTFAVAAVSGLVFAIDLGFFVGGAATLPFAVFAGAATGVFMASATVTTQVFARRPARLIVIDAGYHLASATLAGALFGLIH